MNLSFGCKWTTLMGMGWTMFICIATQFVSSAPSVIPTDDVTHYAGSVWQFYCGVLCKYIIKDAIAENVLIWCFKRRFFPESIATKTEPGPSPNQSGPDPTAVSSGAATKFWLEGGGDGFWSVKPTYPKFRFLLKFRPLYFESLERSRNFG